jgi:hypothetical protein
LQNMINQQVSGESGLVIHSIQHPRLDNTPFHRYATHAQPQKLPKTKTNIKMHAYDIWAHDAKHTQIHTLTHHLLMGRTYRG